MVAVLSSWRGKCSTTQPVEKSNNSNNSEHQVLHFK